MKAFIYSSDQFHVVLAREGRFMEYNIMEYNTMNIYSRMLYLHEGQF